MKNKYAFLTLFLCLILPVAAKDGKFRIDYNYVALYNADTEEWGDWKERLNTFVFNYNDNNDILHVKADSSKVIYRKLSGIEEGNTNSGKHYQILRALDEDGDSSKLQVYDSPEDGAKIIYSNLIVQFSKH